MSDFRAREREITVLKIRIWPDIYYIKIRVGSTNHAYSDMLRTFKTGLPLSPHHLRLHFDVIDKTTGQILCNLFYASL